MARTADHQRNQLIIERLTQGHSWSRIIAEMSVSRHTVARMAKIVKENKEYV